MMQYYKVHLNTLSNGELSCPLCDNVNRGLTVFTERTKIWHTCNLFCVLWRFDVSQFVFWSRKTVGPYFFFIMNNFKQGWIPNKKRELGVHDLIRNTAKGYRYLSWPVFQRFNEFIVYCISKPKFLVFSFYCFFMCACVRACTCLFACVRVCACVCVGGGGAALVKFCWKTQIFFEVF